MTDGLTQLLLAARAALGDGVTAEDAADAAWLARWLTPAAPADPTPEGPPEPPALEGPDVRPPERPPEPHPPLAPADASAGHEDGPIDPARAAPVAAGLPAPPGLGTGAGQVFGARAAPALSNPLALARALRPLARRAPSRARFDLDTDATIHRFADERVLTPVLRPVPERWLRLALVADGGVGGELWHDTVREFRAVLVNVGAFRDVRVWALDADGPEPRVAPFGAPGPATRHPDELLDPLGGTLTVVLSPFIARGWRDGSAARVLNRWAARGPVALVPLLPERMWARTALEATTAVQVSAPAPGVANARLRWARPRPALRLPPRLARPAPEPAPAPGEPPRVPLPLAALEPDALKRWAAVIAGRPGATAPGVLYEPPAAPTPPADPADPPPAEPTAEQRLKQFWLTSSPLAQRLAGLLAAAPVSAKVLGVIRARLLPGAGPAHEAEVLFSGLLRRTSPRGESDPRFEFHPGVRELLLGAARPDDSLSVLEEVSDYLREWFADGRSFRTVLADPSGAAGPLAADGTAFARIAAEVLLRAGGAYAKLVRPAAPPPPPAPVPPRAAESSQAPISRRRPPAGAEVGAPAAAPAPEPAPPPEPDDYPIGYESEPDPDENRFRRAAALVIGIGQYAHPDLPPIPTACADAVAVAERLGDPNVCRFFPHSIAVLTDAVATREAIDRHLRHWLAQEAREAELVVLYFAGYGANGYLLPHDADPHSPFASALPVVDLAEYVNRLGGRAALVCLDCHPDPKGVNRSTWWVRKHLGRPAGVPRPRYVLASAQEEQPLLAAPDGPHSLFAWHLLRGLAGAADRDGDGRVGAAELCAHVADAVARDARARGAEQTPWVITLAAGDDFVSAPAPGAAADPITVAPEAPAEYWDELPNRPEEPTPVPVDADPATAPPVGDASAEFVPHEFGPYFLLGQLGSGGMGAVYRAQPLAGGPQVALKALHRRLHTSPTALERFSREYEVLQRLRHPGVVAALDFGQEDGAPYFTMDLVPGKTLDLAPPRDRAEAVRLVRRVAEAMEHVHAAGVVHGDLKLSNIIVRPDGAPVIVDFGVARTEGDEEPDEESSGAPVGTLPYMAPEQLVRGPGAASPLSDVYALGAGLYKLLAGRLPFQGNFTELVPQIAQGRITPPAELVPGLDPRLNAVVLRALAFRPEDRFPSMAAFAEALAAREDAPGAPEPPPPAAADPPTVDPGASIDRFARLPCDFGPYRLLERLWAGDQGRAAVFGGRDEGHDRPVVVTVLRGDADPERRRAFLHEADILRRLSDRNVRCAPRLFDAGEIDGFEFAATERLNGQRLDEFWAERGGPLGPGGLAQLVARVARDVGTLHRALAPGALVLRDLNPRGVILATNEGTGAERGSAPRVVVVGFASATVRPAGTAETDGRGRVWVLVGATEYTAPEAGTEPGPRSDVYSLGAVLYKLLTGHLPREEDADSEAPGRPNETRPLPELRPPSSFDPRLAPFDAICRTALAWRPEDRYATMNAFADALDALNAREKGPRSTDWEPAADVPAPAPAAPAEPAPFDREEIGDVTVVRITDERFVDDARVQIVGEALLSLLNRFGRKVVIDLSRLTGATNELLGRLVIFQRMIQADSGRLVLCGVRNGLPEQFALAKLNNTFTFARDASEALQLLNSR